MTYKEAIRVLQVIKEHPSRGVYLPDEYEALDLAIMSLQEFDRMKLICANEGIIVYKIKENKE